MLPGGECVTLGAGGAMFTLGAMLMIALGPQGSLPAVAGAPTVAAGNRSAAASAGASHSGSAGLATLAVLAEEPSLSRLTVTER